MRRILLNIIITIISFYYVNLANSEDLTSNETELNFFTVMFDFSDHKQKSGIIGLQHLND